MLPYFYTFSWETHQNGSPIVRPVFWADAEDAALWGVDDAFLLGDALMVCPVFEEGARSRPVLLPKGHWYNFWSGDAIAGPGQVNLEAPLEQIPLLVKAGSILTMESGEQLILHLYTPVERSSESYLYSDAGDGYREWRIERWFMVRKENNLELIWEEEGEYAFHYQGVQLYIHGITVKQAWVDDREVAIDGKDGDVQSIRIGDRARNLCFNL